MKRRISKRIEIKLLDRARQAERRSRLGSASIQLIFRDNVPRYFSQANWKINAQFTIRRIRCYKTSRVNYVRKLSRVAAVSNVSLDY